MSVYTNGTRLCYFDPDLNAAPIFCVLHGKVIAVTPSLNEAIEVVNQGVTNYKRFVQMNTIPKVVSGHVKQDINEYRRKAGAKFPSAFIF